MSDDYKMTLAKAEALLYGVTADLTEARELLEPLAREEVVVLSIIVRLRTLQERATQLIDFIEKERSA